MTTPSESTALHPELVPIIKDDILTQIVREGIQVTEAIETLANTIARRLEEQGVLRRTDGKQVDAQKMGAATEATGMLLDLQNSIRGAATPDTLDLDADEVYQAASAVKMAVALLIGDLDDPSIEHTRRKIRLTKLRQGL